MYYITLRITIRRFVLGIKDGDPVIVYHKNKDVLDNRKSNLTTNLTTNALQSLNSSLIDNDFKLLRYKDRFIYLDADDYNRILDLINLGFRLVIANKGAYLDARIHRLIMNEYFNNLDMKDIVDHINLDTLDNRTNNLRICSISENNRNKSKDYLLKFNKSFKGVRKVNGKYIAAISVNNKSLHLGCFFYEDSAALAYDIAAKEHYKDFAVLNFPTISIQEMDLIGLKETTALDLYKKDKILKGGKRINPKKYNVQSSRFLGVYYNKKRNLYDVYISINKKRSRLGSYKNELDAANAYNSKIIELKLDRILNVL